MNLAILEDRYQLADNFEQRATHFDFPAGVWNIAAELAGVSKAASLVELEKLTGQSPDQIRGALERLLAKKLVRQNLISWKEFIAAREKAHSAANGSADAVPQDVAAKVAEEAAIPPVKQVIPTPALAAKPAQPQAAAAAPTVPNGHLAQPGVAIRLGTITPPKPAVSGTNGWVWQKPEAAKVAASMPVIPAALPNGEQPHGRLLRPMLAQIENLKGGVEGQLLVYQVFLRVPYQLLHDEGIKALHLVDERTVIQNPVLHAAIVKAAKDVTGVELT
jgi:hypothetical protein